MGGMFALADQARTGLQQCTPRAIAPLVVCSDVNPMRAAHSNERNPDLANQLKYDAGSLEERRLLSP